MSYSHWGGFESTKIHGTGKDVLGTTRHIERWQHDLTLLLDANIRELRYPAPWHRIERKPGEFDFRWMDGPMRFLCVNGMRPVVDPMHHTSFPDWLEDGFANPQFPELYRRFVEAIALRYSWVRDYTIFNEPLATTIFCSYAGIWHPHGKSDEEFVRMAVNVAKAICLVSETLLRLNRFIRLVHVDTCETHAALDLHSQPWVDHANERRFLMHDLVLGRVDAHHALYSYLRKHGAAETQLAWLADHPARIDLLGLDYYCHSEIDWQWNKRLERADIVFPTQAPLGFAALAKDYVDRYQIPVALTETNIRGTVTDRLSWLRFMEEEAQKLVRHGVDFRAFCWYPSIDSTDWCHLCTRCSNSVDPQGIWWLDEDRWERHSSELSDRYTGLARGSVRVEDLLAYRFAPPVDRNVSGYAHLMSHWDNWIDPETVEQVA